MILETVCVGSMQVNCYILASHKNGRAIIIDPGDELEKIKRILDKHSLSPEFIINTHGHYDHIGCDDKFGVPVYIHKKELALLKDPRLNFSAIFALPYRCKSEIKLLEDQEIITLEDLQLKVVHVPGHSPGGIALLLIKPDDKIAFTGDSLFYQGIGRTDFPGGNTNLLIKSIKEKLLTLSDDTVIYPGHGQTSTIGQEKKSNPYFTI